MTIRCIRINPVGITTPQCCAKMVPLTEYQKRGGYIGNRKAKADRHGWEWDQCLLSSSHKIDGKYYCPKHASIVALQLIEAAGVAPV